MKLFIGIGMGALVLLGRVAFADSAAYVPVATGFTLPDAQQAVSATSLTGTLDGSQIVGNITNVGVVRASGNIVAGGNVIATGYVNGSNGLYSGNGVYATDYYGRSGGANANFNGAATSAGSAASLTGTLDGSQIVGNITNVGVVRASGNIVAGGNLVATGYVNGNNGLYSGSGVYATDYYGRGGGSNANFNGTATSANYATNAGSTNYAANTDIGILYQHGSSGDGSSFYCDTGYHLQFYDLNVDSTNNAFFYECIQNGH